MRPHKFALQFCLLLTLLLVHTSTSGQQRKAPSGGRIAIVVDERLAALRSTPELNGYLVRRLGRGRLVAIRSMKTTRDGVVFFFVNVTTRTRGWIQRESVVSPSRSGDDARLFRLIQHSHDFDRIARARIFLDHFRRSPLRPAVLLLLGDTAESSLSQTLCNRDSQTRKHGFRSTRIHLLPQPPRPRPLQPPRHPLHLQPHHQTPSLRRLRLPPPPPPPPNLPRSRRRAGAN